MVAHITGKVCAMSWLLMISGGMVACFANRSMGVNVVLLGMAFYLLSWVIYHGHKYLTRGRDA
jgi:hypothetical protein